MSFSPGSKGKARAKSEKRCIGFLHDLSSGPAGRGQGRLPVAASGPDGLTWRSCSYPFSPAVDMDINGADETMGLPI